MGVSPPASPALLFGLALLVGSPIACSSGNRPELYPVKGQVLYKGSPLAKALVVFHPLQEASGMTQKPFAYTDAEGRFTLTTDQPADGAPTGEYAITVEWRERNTSGVEKIKGKNLLPSRFSKAETSGLRCRVEQKTNELAPLIVGAK